MVIKLGQRLSEADMEEPQEEEVNEDETESQSESSTDESTTEESESGDADESEEEEAEDTDSSKDSKDASEVAEGESDKQKAIEALKKEEDKLKEQISDLDREIVEARDRIRELRKDRREKREAVHKVDEVFPSDDQELLKDIDPETIEVFERLAKAKGLVPKAELVKLKYEEYHKDAEDKFFNTYPQYLPENDQDDKLYKALREELSFFTQPKDPKLIPVLFERAHKAVKERFPSYFKTDKESIAIAETRVRKAGLGGRTGGSSSGTSRSKTTSGLTEQEKQIYRNGGWTEEEIKALENK